MENLTIRDQGHDQLLQMKSAYGLPTGDRHLHSQQARALMPLTRDGSLHHA